MPTPFETLRLLPPIAGSRFGSIALGYDRVSDVRREHTLLVRTVGLLLGIDPDHLTVEDVETFNTRLQARAISPLADRVQLMHKMVGLVDGAVTRKEYSPESLAELASDAAAWVWSVGQ
jgi:hypothetical protein